MICTGCKSSVDVEVAELEDGDAKKMRSRLTREQRAKETPGSRSASSRAAAAGRWRSGEVAAASPLPAPIEAPPLDPPVEVPATPVVEAGAGAAKPPKKPPAASATGGDCPRCGGRSLACMTKRCNCECHGGKK